MSSTEEPPGRFGNIRVGRHWLPVELVVVGSIVGVASILGIGFLISLKSNAKQVNPLCPEIASFSLAENETRVFTLNDGSRAVVEVTSADSSSSAGTLMVGEQVDSVRFSLYRTEDWHDFRVTMLESMTLGSRPTLTLVASDCTSPSGTK
jgi:hypothetical protein